MTRQFSIDKMARILVTGANGFIGVMVVATLLEYGYTHLRCFVRPSSHLERLKAVIQQYAVEQTVELVSGDLLTPEDCARAANSASVIYHLAAGFDKSFAGAFMNSALTTRNLMDAFLQRGESGRFVNVSSFAVYSNLTLKRGALLDEDAPLETSPQERYDAYGFGKLKQESLVREYGLTLHPWYPTAQHGPCTTGGPGRTGSPFPPR